MSQSSSEDRCLQALDRALVVNFWKARFGMPESALGTFRFYRRAKSIWMSSDVDLPCLYYETVGLRILSLKDNLWKPTTCALQILGRYATKNFIDLGKEEARIFMAGESQEIQSQAEPGYVVVSHKGQVLGCGLYSRGRLISQIPKERRIQDESAQDESSEVGDI